jgi:hypothetical protein
MGLSLAAGPARLLQTAHASEDAAETKKVTPLVFQAAGPTLASIQSMVDAYRAALGSTNNGNAPGPLASGRREINWDGGGSTDTSIVPTPFDGFLVNRGGRFTTKGTGFVQAPVEGLATTFNNSTYATIFAAFSPVRLFSPIESNRTTALFFVPGGGEIPATTAGFGAVFSDVDRQGGDEHGSGHRDQATSMSFYNVWGDLLYSSGVPASPGDAGFSFLGVLFYDAPIAYVKITTGNAVPGRNDTARRDVVMMDDFLYGEPQQVEDAEAINALQMIQAMDDF